MPSVEYFRTMGVMIVENIVKAIVLMAKVKHTCFFSILCLVTHPPPKIIGHISFKFSGILWSKYNLNSSLKEWKCANWCFSADVNVNPGHMLQMCKNQLAPLYLVTVYILSVYIFLQILDFQSDHFQFLPLYPGIWGGMEVVIEYTLGLTSSTFLIFISFYLYGASNQHHQG